MRKLFFVLLLFAFSYSAPISTCTDITSPGYYELTTDLIGSVGNTYFNVQSCIWVNASDVIFDCKGFNIINMTLVTPPSYSAAISMYNVSNVTIENCILQGQGMNIYINESNNTLIKNNSLLDGQYNAVIYANSFNSIAENNTVLSNYVSPILFSVSGHNITIRKNRFYNGSSQIQISYPSDQIIVIEENFFSKKYGSQNLYAYPTRNITVRNNYFESCAFGCIYFRTGSNVSIENNTFNLTSLGGVGTIALDSLTNIDVSNNSVFIDPSLPSLGFFFNNIYLRNVYDYSITNNFVNSSYLSPSLFVFNGVNGTIFNNTLYRSFGSGFFASGVSATVSNLYIEDVITSSFGFSAGLFSTSSTLNGSNITIRKVNTTGSTQGGGILISGSTLNFSEVLISNISGTNGFGISTPPSPTLSNVSVNSVIVEGTSVGIVFNAAESANFTNAHLYNNTIDLRIEPNPTIPNRYIYFDGAFDSDGSLSSYVNLSLEDAVNTTENYEISWSSPIPVPPGNTSFRNKFLNISAISPSFIQRTYWKWTDAEASGYTESDLSLWKFDGINWTLVSNTVVPPNNYIIANSIQNFSIFAILHPLLVTNGGNGGSPKTMDVELFSDCGTTYVNITSSGVPLSGVNVLVTDLFNFPLGSGQTDSEGIFVFDVYCGTDFVIKASESGYYPETIVASSISCDLCVPSCDENQQLVNGSCIPISCDCGYIEDGQCITYECCSDSDCPSGYACNNNQCEPQGCLTDNDCAGNEYCNIPNGELVGSCEPVTGECGYAENHQWINYECCSDSDCPSNKVCEQNVCVFYEIDCVETVNVNENIECVVKKDGQLCKECVVDVKDPKLVERMISTNSLGVLSLPARSVGVYQFTIGSASDSVDVLDIILEPEAKEFEWWICLLSVLLLSLLLFIWCKLRKRKWLETIKELYDTGQITEYERKTLLNILKNLHCWERFKELEEYMKKRRT